MLTSLQELGMPWELLAWQPRHLTYLSGLTSLEVDFHHDVDSAGEDDIRDLDMEIRMTYETLK